MPQSFILNLVTQSAVPRQHLQGYALQQLFFSLVETVDPELAHVLRRDKQNRSYSLSAIQTNSFQPSVAADSTTSTANYNPTRPVGKRQATTQTALRLVPSSASACPLQYSHHQPLSPNTQCWWRISFLDDALFDHLIFLWMELQDESFQLGAGSVVVTGVTAKLPGFSWATCCSYSTIYEQASEHERNIHLQFVTPTTFEIEGHITPLPTAEAVFHPLLKYWNRHSGLAFSPLLIDHIVPTHFALQTEAVQHSQRRSIQSLVGCTGQISFRIAGDRNPLLLKQLNALADVSHYCGIGRNAQFGMGIVRRIEGQTRLEYQSQMS